MRLANKPSRTFVVRFVDRFPLGRQELIERMVLFPLWLDQRAREVCSFEEYRGAAGIDPQIAPEHQQLQRQQREAHTEMLIDKMLRDKPWMSRQ